MIEKEISAARKRPVPEEKMKDMFLKLRKGASAWLTMGKMIQVFDRLGWAVDPFFGWTSRHYPYMDKEHLVDENSYMPRRGGEGMGGAGRSEGPMGVQGLKKLHEELRELEVNDLPPSPQKTGQTVVMDVGPIQQNDNYFYFTRREWVGTEGVTVTSPRGEEASFLPDHNDLDHKGLVFKEASDLWAWAKTVGILDDINGDLNMKAHVPASERTREHTGTCPVCFGNYKMDGEGDMVLHGYKRPGVGYVEGQCLAVRMKPLEISSDGAVEYLSHLEDLLSDKKKELADLESGDVKWLKDGTGRIERGHPHFPRMLENFIHGAKSLVKQIERDIDLFTRIVKAWRLRPLPRDGEPQRTHGFFLK